MRKFFYAVGVVITLAIVAGVSASAAWMSVDRAPVAQRVAVEKTQRFVHPDQPADVRVVLNDSGAHGSAVHIGNGYFITAAHVADGPPKRFDIQLRDKSIRKAEILWINKIYDIALFRADAAGISAKPPKCDLAAEGTEIKVAGNPLALGFTISFGHIAGAARAVGPWKSVYVTDVTAAPGNSGGPVFNAKDEFIGVMVGGFFTPVGFGASVSGFTAVVPSAAVCELLARAS